MGTRNDLKRLTKGIRKRGTKYYLSFQNRKKRRWVCLHTDDLSIAITEATRVRHSKIAESGDLIEYSVIRFVADMRRKRMRGERTGWADATARSKTYVLKNFAKFAAKLRPGDVSPAMMAKFHEERAEESSAWTAFGNLMTVRSYFNWCVKTEKTATRNPCIGLDVEAPAPRPRRNYCQAELVAALIKSCPREDIKYVLYCGFHCGMRFLEIVESVPWWFELDKAQVHLRKTPTINFKDQEERIIPMTSEFVRFVEDDYGLQQPFMLHPEKDKHGKNRYRYDFTRPFDLYMASVALCCGELQSVENKKCRTCEKELEDCSWVTPHVMRHTFASLLASTHPMDGGPSDFEICTWMGIDLRTYQKTYAKLRPRPRATEAAFQIKSQSHPSPPA